MRFIILERHFVVLFAFKEHFIVLLMMAYYNWHSIRQIIDFDFNYWHELSSCYPWCRNSLGCLIVLNFAVVCCCFSEVNHPSCCCNRLNLFKLVTDFVILENSNVNFCLNLPINGLFAFNDLHFNDYSIKLGYFCLNVDFALSLIIAHLKFYILLLSYLVFI